MFKKKPIYIVGLILFTALLIANLAIRFLVPTAGGGRGELPSTGSSRPDRGDFNAGDFGGNMPDMGDFDFGDFGGGQMPDMGEFDFSDFDGQFPGNTDSASTDSGSLLTTIRNGFWPILIVCVLGDALCIFMLMRISKAEGVPEEDEEDTVPRRDYTNPILAVVAAVLVIAVILTGLPSGNQGGGIEAEISVLEAQATQNDIAGIFSGSGTLQSSDAAQMELPSGITLTAYNVKSGDTVLAGDVIAQVDKTSVLTTIYEIQAMIKEMDEEIAEVQGNTLSDSLTARAAGRVKVIYVSEGDSIAAAMYENGAVILLSLGGSMTAIVESDADASVGQTVTVTLSDGTQIEGKVQQVRGGKITITTTDDGPTPDDTVTVSTEDGEELGSGTLHISSPLKVTGYWGTVGSVEVSVGDEVTMGDTLITLNDIADVARYQALLSQRETLTDLVAELTVIYQDGCIMAAADGIISDLQEDVPYAKLTASTKARTTVTMAPTDSGMTSMGGFNTGTDAGTTDSSSGMDFGTQEEQEANYAVTKTTVCAITPAETMTVDVSVDELDILSMAVGQEITVTLDALPGQSFTGSVQKIDTTGTNDGGSTKYTVTMELPRTEQMLGGMNASVRIEVSRMEAVLTVPAEAIYEDGTRTYVYTAMDEKTGEPASPVEVTTGASDGAVIEILSGLAEGDTVYYSYADSITYNFKT